MQTRPRQDLTAAELALAYELRGEGCSFTVIAIGLHCDPRGLGEAVRDARRDGVRHRGPRGYERRTHHGNDSN